MKPFAKLLAGAALLAMVATVWPLPVKVVKCFGGGGSSDFCVISTNAISFYYRLNEASGSARVDAAGNLANLTEASGLVASYAGKITNAAGFDNTKTQYLAGATSANLADITNGDATITYWVNLTNTTATQVVASKNGTATGARGWQTGYDSLLQQWYFTLVGTNGMGMPTSYTINSTNGGAPTSNTWYFVCAQFCRASNYLVSGGSCE